MTTIAISGGNLIVGDRYATRNNDKTRLLKSKLIRYDGGWAGFAGISNQIEYFLMNLSYDLPAVTGLFLKDNGEIFKLINGQLFKLDCRFAAIGSGAVFAEKQLSLGANAISAIQEASKFDKNTSLEYVAIYRGTDKWKLNSACSAAEIFSVNTR